MAVSEAQKRASQKYDATHYKRIPLNVNNADYDKIKEAAGKLGMSVNGFIRDTVFDKIDELNGYFDSLDRKFEQ